MRIIDADKLLADETADYELVNARCDSELQRLVNRHLHEELQRLIGTAPTVDAVEVVRCKDCELCEYDADKDQYFCILRIMRVGTKTDYYCSHGERRKGNDT